MNLCRDANRLLQQADSGIAIVEALREHVACGTYFVFKNLKKIDYRNIFDYVTNTYKLNSRNSSSYLNIVKCDCVLLQRTVAEAQYLLSMFEPSVCECTTQLKHLQKVSNLLLSLLEQEKKLKEYSTVAETQEGMLCKLEYSFFLPFLIF